MVSSCWKGALSRAELDKTRLESGLQGRVELDQGPERIPIEIRMTQNDTTKMHFCQPSFAPLELRKDKWFWLKIVKKLHIFENKKIWGKQDLLIFNL